jgi:DNA-binding CsgD family transcriptional regulator
MRYLLQIKSGLWLVLLIGFVASFMTSCGERSASKSKDDSQKIADQQKIDSVFDDLMEYSNNCPDSAETAALIYEKEFEQQANYSALIRLYSFLSELYQYRKNDDSKALNYIIKALDLYSQHPETEFDNTYLYVNAGNILYRYDMFVEAINVYQQTKKVANPKKHPGILALIDNNIGLAFQELDKCDSALYYFSLAENEIPFSGIKTYLKKVQSNNYKISLFLDCKIVDSIPYYFNENSRMFGLIDNFLADKTDTSKLRIWNDIEIDYYTNKVRSTNSMANYYAFLGQFENSEKMFADAVEFAQLAGDFSWLITVYQGWADANVKIKSYKAGQQILDTTLQLALKSSSDFSLISDIYSKKADLSKLHGDFIGFTNYNRLAQLYNDSINQAALSGEIVSKRIALAIKPVELAMKNVELSRNEILQNYAIRVQLAEKQEEAVRYRYLFFTGLLLLFLGITLFLLYRNRSRKKLAEVSLEVSEREKKYMTNELQNFSMHMSYKNDFLREVQTALKIISQDASEVNKARIKELTFKIARNLQSSKEAKLIEEKIKEINSGFFFKLSENFPDLTEKDKNLCALVRMNLTSKEIASINNISERSVITARYRLRRKLNLDNDENLNAFLNQF